MKLNKSYILSLAAAIAFGTALTGCQDVFDAPQVDAPVATLKPNMTILELKEKYWQDATNYIDTIGIENGVDDGNEYVIAGRVISSDEAGNIFKSLVIQDETAALALSINSYNLYLNYRVGQEIVINLKGMYIGKYNGLVQLGMPEWYAAGNAWEATFMAPEFFQEHIELNGFPNASKIDTLEINSFNELPSNPEGLQKYQSQLVKFNNVYFQNAGEQQFSEYHSSGINQNIIDVNGSSLPVRTSGYSNFWNNYLPKGNGDVVCILSFYGTTGWQLLLNDYEGCMNFGNPTVSPGTEDNPWSILDAIATIQSGKPKSGWVNGYIVGAVAPEVTSVTSNNDIEWSDKVILPNTLVIGATPDTKDISQAMVISLPQNSVLRQYGNLADNPDNYKKEIWIKGKFGQYMDTYGILDNNGTASEFKIEGVEINTGEAPNGDGTEAKPYNVAQVIAKNPQGNGDNPDEKGVWVTGYIVGWADMTSIYYINAETARFTVPATLKTNMLIAATPDVTDYSKCLGIQLPSGAVRNALNLQDNPGNLGKKVELHGDICKYSGVPGMRNSDKYILGDGGSTPDIPDTPTNPVTSINQNFDADKNVPAGWTQVQVSGDKTWYVTTFNDNNYIAMTGYKGTTPPFDQWLITPPVDMSKVSDKVLSFDTQVNGYGSTTSSFEVYVLTNNDPSKGNKTKLNPVLASAPESGYSSWVNSGNIDLSAYSGIIYIGFRYYATQDANYATWCLDNVVLGKQGGSVAPTGNSADFNTLNGGIPNSMSYATYQTAAGWTADWSLVLSGGTDATNFVSTDASFLFPCIDGTIARPGKLTSPLLSGSLKKLSFNYGFPYNETKVAFTVNIIQNGKTVASDQVVSDPATKSTIFSFEKEYNITGDFQIEIVNDCITQSTKNNGDRVAIWNLSWTN